MMDPGLINLSKKYNKHRIRPVSSSHNKGKGMESRREERKREGKGRDRNS